MKLARFSLWLMAVAFLGLGIMSLIAPTNLTDLVELCMPTSVAVMEVRGVYGGLFAGIGFLFLLFARRRWLKPGLVAQAAIMGGFVVGRLIGIAIGGYPNVFIAALLAGEVFMMSLALLLLARDNVSTVV